MKLFRLSSMCCMFILLCATLNLSQNRLKYNFDYSIFGYDSLSNYMEIYYSLDKSRFRLSDSLIAIGMEVTIVNSQNDTIINKNYILKDSLNANNNFDESIGVLKFVIPREELLLNLNLTDKNNSTISKNVKYKILSTNLLNKNNQISEIELAKLITNDTTKSQNIFDKNNYTVVPNPSLVFDDNFSQLYFYTELYNLKSNNRKLLFSQQLFNPIGKLIYKRKSALPSISKSKVQVGVINLTGLESGAYSLVLQIVDSLDNVLTFQKKKFYYYTKLQENINTSHTAENNFLSSEFGIYSEEECDNIMSKTRYVATGKELEQYKSLTELEAKRKFLYQFWKKRDDNKSTTINEYKNEVMNRVEEADKRFGALKKDGATTDRGRVLILYGMPDEIDKYPNESGFKPYEIWKYHNMEGGVIFVFGDLIGLEDFRLLHSTKRGELSQPNWLESLRGN